MEVFLPLDKVDALDFESEKPEVDVEGSDLSGVRFSDASTDKGRPPDDWGKGAPLVKCKKRLLIVKSKYKKMVKSFILLFGEMIDRDREFLARWNLIR